MMDRNKGYTLIILMISVAVMSIGLLVAIPVLKTQLQREKEEELIFRGKQYIEAIRLFQIKYPGRFPKTLEQLLEEKCVRKLYEDPMTKDDEWNVILHHEGISSKKKRAAQKILIAPQRALPSIDNPQILGVVSSSTQESIKIYNDQTAYDKWLFYYGQDPKKMPEIIYYGQTEKEG